MTPPLRLLLAHGLYAEEGGENAVFRTLGDLLRERGHEVVEYTREGAELHVASRAAQARAVWQAFGSPRTERELTALVAGRRPQVALVQNVFPLLTTGIFPLLRRLGVPVAHLVYNYRLICPDAQLYTHGQVCERCVHHSLWNAVRWRCYRGSATLSAWYAAQLAHGRARGHFAAIQRYLVPDAFLGERLVAGGVPASRIAVVGNPFDATGWSEPREDARGSALFVGRLVPQKGLLTLIRALAGVPGPLDLRVVGAGELHGEAERLAAELVPGRVTFLGPLWGEDVRREILAARFVCVPSEWYDNLPLVVCQALAASRALLVSRIGGLRESVREDVDALLAGPGDVAEWADALRRLDQDEALRATLARAGGERARRELTADAYHQRLVQAITPLVAE